MPCISLEVCCDDTWFTADRVSENVDVFLREYRYLLWATHKFSTIGCFKAIFLLVHKVNVLMLKWER